jgi:hypothetical protein
MKSTISFFLAFSALILAGHANGQDTLPRFSARNVGKGNIIIGWVNNYDLVKQISIQSSHDSAKNFKTILSVTDPMAKMNGFADTKAINDHLWYRLFIVLDKGQYVFTAAMQPVLDTARTSRNQMIELTKDTTASSLTKPVVPRKPDFIPSFYVYTNRDGYVFINLPDADKKKYRIRFYEENDDFLFEIKSIQDPGLTLDKTNFLHSGWFKFELYNEEKLVEKNKFFLGKEF